MKPISICLSFILGVLLTAGCCSSKPKLATAKPVPVDAPARAVTLQNIPHLIWTGELDAAERSARAVLKTDTYNNAAYYYLSLIEERRHPQPPKRSQSDLMFPTLPPRPAHAD